MCWKREAPAPEPSTPMAIIGSATDSTLNVTTQAGGVGCPDTASPCNSTDITCHNGGVVCCLTSTSEAMCACAEGYEGTNCAEQIIDDPFASTAEAASYNTKVIVIALFVVFAVVVTVVVIFLVRKKRLQRQRNSHSSDFGPEEPNVLYKPETSGKERSVQESLMPKPDANGNDKG